MNIKVEYIDDLDMFLIIYQGRSFLVDEVEAFEITGGEIKVAESLPEVVEVARNIFVKANYEHSFEESIMLRRKSNVKLFPVGLPTSMTRNNYKKFIKLGTDDLLPRGFLEKLAEIEVDPLHRLIGSYFTGYLNIGGSGPYAIFDPVGAVYDAYVAVKRYSDSGRVLPAGWWTRLYYRNYSGNASFTVYGELHSANRDNRVWVMNLYRDRSKNDIRIVHLAFLKAIKEFGGIDFNKEVKKLDKRTFKDLGAFISKTDIMKNFEKNADHSLFDEIMMPPEFRSPVNYILLRDYSVIAVPSLKVDSRVVPKELRSFAEIIKKKFEKVL